jgi:CsoR family transcriptional regulator, copper-sensing transcriptional repressor
MNTPGGYAQFMNTKLHSQLQKRLKIVEGQIRGLQRQLSEGAYCIDILQQAAAARQALSGVEDLILENHLKTCAIEQMKTDRSAKAIAEIMNVYRLLKK